jgi:putative transposase
MASGLRTILDCVGCHGQPSTKSRYARAKPVPTSYDRAMPELDEHHRKLRASWNEPGHAHELTFSCRNRWPLLSKDRTRNWLIQALDRARRRHHFDLWAYVIMPEHVHVLLFPRKSDYEISGILRAIKQPVANQAMAYLRKHDPAWLERLRVVGGDGRSMHRFWLQGGGYDRNVHQPETAWKCVLYLHANPVRRGLCHAPTDWAWSSARWYEGLDDVMLDMDDPPPWPSLPRSSRRRIL